MIHRRPPLRHRTVQVRECSVGSVWTWATVRRAWWRGWRLVRVMLQGMGERAVLGCAWPGEITTGWMIVVGGAA